MPTIRKRGQYQWEAQVRRRGYPAQSKTFTTKAEAVDLHGILTHDLH